jgi:phosphodiesterase/alkaline phosphatase D-like protein
LILSFNNHEISGKEISNQILSMTEGVASGDVTNDSAIISSRTNQHSNMNVEFVNNYLFLNF